MQTFRKRSIDDLAYWSRSASFKEPLHVGTPTIGNRKKLLSRFNAILDARWFTNNGPIVQEFEAALSEYLGVKHCLTCANGTIALQLAAQGMDLTGEVIVPSFTFVATVHAMLWQGLIPVFCDVDPDTHQINPSLVEDLITERTSAILGVHMWGSPCDTEAIANIAMRHDLKVIYDAAHAFGCERNGTKVGNFGDAECFSFHATKFVNSFEGGAIATNDDAFAERIRLLRNFGFAGKDNVIHVGTNGKMSEISAAMGLTSLEAVDELMQHNVAMHQIYKRELRDLNGINVLRFDNRDRHNHQYLVARVDAKETSLSRDEFVQLLVAEGVEARRYFHPGVHDMEPYRTQHPIASDALPVTKSLCDSVMVLPTGGAVTAEQVKIICELLDFIVLHQKEIKKRINP